LFKLEGDHAALPTVAEILRRQPDHAGANFVQGRYLLAQGDPAGVTHVERAMAADAGLGMAGLELLHQHYRRQGETEKLRELEALGDQHQAVTNQAKLERADLKPTDVFEPHELPPAELAGVLELLAAEPAVRRACLARKQVKYLPAQRLYVLGLDLRKTFRLSSRVAANRLVVQNLVKSIHLPGAVFIFVAEGKYRPIGRAVAAVPGSIIYNCHP
jgi:hypothetical protein